MFIFPELPWPPSAKPKKPTSLYTFMPRAVPYPPYRTVRSTCEALTLLAGMLMDRNFQKLLSAPEKWEVVGMESWRNETIYISVNSYLYI